MVSLSISSSYKTGVGDIPWDSWDVENITRKSSVLGFDFTNGNDLDFGGKNLRYDADGVPYAGTVTSLAFTVGGKKVVTAEGLKFYAANLSGLFADGFSVEDLLQSSLSGKDTFKGGAGADRLLTYGGDDTIDGRGGADLIIGGVGKDKLTGGSGNDTFVFNTAFKSGNVDRITDFSNKSGNNDTLELDSEFFIGTTGSHLPEGMFKTVSNIHSTKGLDRDDHILYDKKNGDLYYDRDGSGGKYDPMKFAHLDNHAALSAGDFMVI
jgi:Ca2+-binding RTX toxin-like protein